MATASRAAAVRRTTRRLVALLLLAIALSWPLINVFTGTGGGAQRRPGLCSRLQLGPYKQGPTGGGSSGYEEMKKDELKAMLREVGLPTSGTKAELLNRLYEYTEYAEYDDSYDEDESEYESESGVYSGYEQAEEEDCEIEGLEECTIPQLKSRLKASGLSTKGDKEDLVDRLWADYYHRHFSPKKSNPAMQDIDFD
eukprot:TRINITY_DN113283_c0_g1_i1.p1 TRINITY_DN113283_c0_g1~~TRINITY_DN113283_c0_g1_i1.p1  ORF type:complete len:197 (-),score=57.59 TRINITY_DN113283_c0_g1_i1:297-887(-)